MNARVAMKHSCLYPTRNIADEGSRCNMEYVDLAAQYKALKHDIDRNIQKVLTEGNFIMGPEVAELERKLAEYAGTKYCIGVANGTDALEMALMAWGIGPGDAVFVPSFTFVSTAEVVELVHATPVFTDIDGRTFNMDPASLREAILRVKQEGKLVPRVIVTVDLFGLSADYPAIRAIADEFDLLILEDGAQGFGGSINKQRVGSFGDISTTSFFPAKPLGCYGDGGAIFTDNDEYFKILSSIRVHGKGSDKYDNVRTGLNSRLDTLQAAILLPKLEAFEDYELDKRNELANFYDAEISDKLVKPLVPNGYYSSWAQYSLIAPSQEARTAIMAHLSEAGVPTNVYYRTPLHEQTVYAYLGYQVSDFPVSADISRRVFSIPMHPYMTAEDRDKIVRVLNEASEKFA